MGDVVRDEDARSYPEIIPGGKWFLDPFIEIGEPPLKEEEDLMEGTSVTEIHRYPLRPKDHEEPLFPTPAFRRAVAEHLLESPWLHRASDLKERGTHTGEVAHVRQEPVEVEAKGGWVRVVRSGRSRRCSWRRRKVVKVLDRWRLVGYWWDEQKHTDRLLFRVLLSGDEVVDLAREKSGGWVLVGIVD